MMGTFSIRHATPEDLPRILEIYAGARAFMASHNNPRQWCINNWPPEYLLREDIRLQRLFVCCHEGVIAVVFVFLYGHEIERTYREIDGSWAYEKPYGVVHRLASSFICRGAARFCIQWALLQSGYLRIDTHPDNYVMQNLLTNLGFTKRGIIHVAEDSDPRIAYDKAAN